MVQIGTYAYTNAEAKVLVRVQGPCTRPNLGSPTPLSRFADLHIFIQSRLDYTFIPLHFIYPLPRP